jgi:hypothetical protein
MVREAPEVQPILSEKHENKNFNFLNQKRPSPGSFYFLRGSLALIYIQKLKLIKI